MTCILCAWLVPAGVVDACRLLALRAQRCKEVVLRGAAALRDELVRFELKLPSVCTFLARARAHRPTSYPRAGLFRADPCFHGTGFSMPSQGFVGVRRDSLGESSLATEQPANGAFVLVVDPPKLN